MVAIEILPEFGCVILVGVASAFLLVWQGMKIGGQRKKFNITYPSKSIRFQT